MSEDFDSFAPKPRKAGAIEYPRCFPHSAESHKYQAEIAPSIFVVCSKLLTVNRLFEGWSVPLKLLLRPEQARLTFTGSAFPYKWPVE